MNFTSTGNTEVKKGSSSAVDDADAIFLLAPEAERLIEALQPFPLDKVGTEEWLLQHEVIEKLNMQAHQCARSGSEDFILEAMVTYDKLPVIIHELVVIEAWRENVYPLIQMDLAKAGGMRGYFALYHEATLANLLEVALYHDYALEAIGEPLIELLDWAVRRLVYLNALPPDHSELWAPQALTAGKDLQEGLKKIRDRTPEEDQKRQYREVQFKVGVSAVVISRYLCEHASKISLSVFSRLIDTHDLLMLLVPLLDNPPWTRRTDRGKWQKYDDQKWSDVAPANLMKLTKLEGQLWLALYNLLCDKEFRQRYYFNTHRKDSLLRVRKYINDVLVDQLPMLADVQRYMDELTIMKPPEPSQQGTALILEQIPVIRQAITEAFPNWAEEAARQLREIFQKGNDVDKTDRGLLALAELYSGEAMDMLLAAQEMTPEERRGEVVSVSVSCSSSSASFDAIVEATFQKVRGKPKPQSTSMGMFHRFKFALLGSATVESTALPQGAVLRVKLGFEDASSLELASDPIMLPTSPLAMEDDQGPMMAVSTSLPATKWIKIGSVEERAVAQLSLKRMKKVQVPATADRNGDEGIPCYRMSDMFIATPVARTALAGATATKATKATNSSSSAVEAKARDTKGGAAEEKAASTLTTSETKSEEKPRKILIEDVTEVDGLD